MASSSNGAAQTLPPLVKTFPSDKYPLREIGTGFTAQSVRGVDAEACAATAAEMLAESRVIAVSTNSSESSAVGLAMEGEPFPVPDLTLPESAAKVWQLQF